MLSTIKQYARQLAIKHLFDQSYVDCIVEQRYQAVVDTINELAEQTVADKDSVIQSLQEVVDTQEATMSYLQTLIGGLQNSVVHLENDRELTLQRSIRVMAGTALTLGGAVIIDKDSWNQAGSLYVGVNAELLQDGNILIELTDEHGFEEQPTVHAQNGPCQSINLADQEWFSPEGCHLPCQTT